MSGKIKSERNREAATSSMHAYCARCRHRHIFVRAKINHPIHLILSILTFGLWLISWVAVCIGTILRPWRCEHCGWHKPEFRTPPDPAELQQQSEKTNSEAYVEQRITI